MSKLSSAEITKLFKPISDQPNRIYGREGKTVEYKQSYNHAGMAQYFKIMASFANADGGYIIFGIGDSPREFLGLREKSKNQFDSLKIEEFTNNLNEYFQPEILWEHTLFEFRGLDFGIIYTYPLENKPCICTKNYDIDDERSALKEGDIYYRYRARTERIKYSELTKIFIDKEKNKHNCGWI
ncbi:MAG: ATP-binding protein [Tissierellia bacterium]|nr:ATP-binding protein [Tissierellia bacterium]